MARGACAPGCLRAWIGKEASHVCTWGLGTRRWGSIPGGRSGGAGARGAQSSGGSQGPGGTVLLLSGQRPVSAFNCPRLGVAPGAHGRQSSTRPTPPPSRGALSGQTAHLLLLLPLCGRRRVGRGSGPSLERAALPTAPPRRQGRTQEPGAGARCVESGPAVNAHVDAHGLVHGFSPCPGSGTQDRGLWVSAGGAEPAPSAASRSVVLGRGICAARSQGAAGLEPSRWPALVAGGPSERIPAEQRTSTHSSFLEEAVVLALTGNESFLCFSLSAEADLSTPPQSSPGSGGSP